MTSLGSATVSACEGRVSPCAGGGVMLLSGQRMGCLWVVQPSHRMLLALLHLQSNSQGRALWPGRLAAAGRAAGHSSWARRRWSHPWSHLWGQCGTRVTSGSNKRGCLGLTVWLWCWAECAESGWVAGKCPLAVSWPGHPLGPGPRGSTGLSWGGGGSGPLPALPAAPGKLTVADLVLSQRSTITHSQKPRQLFSVPRHTRPRARESIVHEGLLVLCRPPCREVPRSL